MKQWLLFATLCLLLGGCGGKSGGKFGDLLKQPPYDVYTDSIKKEPKRADLYVSRGKLLTQNRQPEAALEDFLQAWNLAATDEHAYYYGGTLVNLQRYDSAIGVLKKASEQFPRSIPVKERLAYAYSLAKKQNEALYVYEQMLQLDPRDFRTWSAVGYIQQDMGNDSLALLSFQNSYGINPIQSTGEELAFLLAKYKNPQTLQFCRMLMERDTLKSSVQPLYCMGVYYKNTGNEAEALKIFDQCIAEDYAFPDAYLDKGEIYYNRRQYEEALKIFQLVKTNNNTYADAYYWAGKCFEALGKRSEAALEYERTLALDKEFTEAKEALGKLK